MGEGDDASSEDSDAASENDEGELLVVTIQRNLPYKLPLSQCKSAACALELQY